MNRVTCWTDDTKDGGNRNEVSEQCYISDEK